MTAAATPIRHAPIAARLARVLSLAAAPAFAAMALLTGSGGGGMPMLCSGGTPPLGGMFVMYLLMSAFHLPPWLMLLRRPHHLARTRAARTRP